MKEAYGKTLEEMRNDTEFQDDILEGDHISITNDGGDVSYFWIEEYALAALQEQAPAVIKKGE